MSRVPRLLRLPRLCRFAVLAIISNVIACASDGTTTAQIQATVNNVVVNLSLDRLVAGQSVQADAIARDAGGAAVHGVNIVWSSSNPAVAKVTPAGLVTAAAPGQADIVATAGNVSAKASITVVASSVAVVTVTLSASTVLSGQQVVATATVRDSNNTVLTNSPVTWTSSDPSVATAANIGAISALAPGTTTITATSGGVSGTASLTVQPVVASVTVRLIESSLSAGDSTTALATVRDASNNILIDKPAAWTSSDVTIATVTPAGQIVAVTPGTVTITGTAEGLSGSATLTVASPVSDITVTLGASTLAVGASTTATAVVKDANNNVITDRGIAWTSSNPAVARVSPGGLVVGVSGGTANVITTVEGVSGSAPVTVTAIGGGSGGSGGSGGGGGGGGGGGTQTATQLAIATQPTNVTSGVDITPAMVVEVRDASNTLVTTSSAIVTASRASGSGTLAGTLSVQAVGGRATFSDIRINGSGVHSFAFNATGLTAATSSSFTVMPAPATQLAITTQPPSSAQVAAVWSQEPVIQLRDANNSAVNQSGVVITANIASGGGALGGTTTAVTNASGTATFIDLSISGAVGPRTLVFSGAGLTSPASTTIGITAGPAAALATATQPASSASSGAAFARQPAIQLRDISNNAVSQAGIVITASIATGSGTLGGTATATTSASGLATFTNLSITGTGSFTLRFAATGLTAATSNTIGVGAAAASKLSITAQPSSSAASGVVLAQQPVIQLRDASNNAVNQAGVIVTATIASGGGTLAGIATATTDATGAAMFTNLVISGAPGTRTLSFSAAGLTSATSSSIAVAAGPASQLSLTTQPSSPAQSGVAFAQQPIVQLLDAANNVVAKSGVVITAAIASGTGGTLGGTTTATTAANGAATFAGLKITGSGAYTLRFTATGLTAVTSTTVTMTAVSPVGLSILTQPSTSAVSGTAFATQPVVQLRDAANNAVNQAGVVVTASILTGGGTLGGSTTATTNASGIAAFSNLSIAGTAGSRTLGFTAPSLASVTSNSISITAGSGGGGGGGGTAGSYPNRPASFTQSTEIDFSQAIPSLPDNVDRPISGAPGWNMIYFGGNWNQMSDPTAPQSAPGVWRGHWAPGSYGGGVIGQGGGHGIGNVFSYTPAGASRLYMSLRVYFDFDPSQWHPISNKFVNIEGDHSQILVQLDEGGNWRHAEELGYTGYNSFGVDFNRNSPTSISGQVDNRAVPNRQWTQIEVLIDFPNHIFKIWQDGVLTTNATPTFASTRINTFGINAFRGGGGETLTTDLYWRYDHFFLAW